MTVKSPSGTGRHQLVVWTVTPSSSRHMEPGMKPDYFPVRHAAMYHPQQVNTEGKRRREEERDSVITY